ncbi:MAG: enoyl-CoA hydratase [Actinobacteria bacterium]|nr:MAG: enoyl-CoA hydratase [Actinomycetota bacterium]
MADDVVLSESRGAVRLLTLNRPDRLNAWTGALEQRYFALLDEAEADPEVRVIVVTGAGKGFCAGADMDMLQGIGEAGGVSDAGAPRKHHPPYYATTLNKPVIGAINGACAGIGLVHAMMTDIRFAAAGAKFTTAFARRGLIAEHGVSWVLPRLVGPARAMDVLLSGRVFLAEEALELGMVNRVCAPQALLDETIAYANDLAANSSPSSMAVMKRQIWAALSQSIVEATNEADSFMRQSLREADFKEGVASFVEKRPPQFLPVQDWTRA